MTTHRMSKYAEEGILQNVEDATFLRQRRNIQADDVFDFSGIRAATPEFLDTLFAEMKSPALVESFRGVEGPLVDALRAWIAPPSVAATAKVTPVVTWTRNTTPEEEKYTP
ncbi:MAG TPA: hypothetical protein PKA58_27470, partial [Polyangium sp.]|nr:hypothetical protein [Polyangium sp.]